MSEDLKPIAPMENPEEQSATVSEKVVETINDVKEVIEEKMADVKEAVENAVEAAPEAFEEIIDYAGKGLKEIVDIFQNLIDKGDMQLLYKHADGIKAAFYKTLKKEKVAAGFVEPTEAPASEETPDNQEEKPSVNPFAEIERGFKDLYATYKAGRAVYVQELNQRKDENFAVKSEVIEELRALVENPEDINKAYPRFRELQNKWKSAGSVPATKAKDLYETYQHCVEKFYDYVKINRELRDLDFKKNLEVKTALCEKAEALANEENPVAAFATLQKLHEEWKEYGPVDKEFRESIWDRFKAATAVVNKRHQEYFESRKGDQKQNLDAKIALCEKVEAIAEQVINDSNTWNALSKEIEEIQKEWKGIGFATKKDNQKVYDRFRAACDKFYASKRDFYSDFKNQMQENMEKKIALCEQAEAIMDSDDWKKTSDTLINLQKQWKEIGPVSRKKSEQIWKRFRAACDKFFDNRDKHFSDQDSQYSDNLAAKLALIEEVENYSGSASDTAALNDFQSRWNAIGFVPIKDKEKVQSAFRKALAAKFENADVRDGGDRVAKFKNRYGDNRGKGNGVHSERDRLVQKFVKMEQDIATWENNMGFFSKSKNAESILADLKEKIGKAKEELAELEEKIKSFDKENEE
ncbi:MAG: DUF349 domain-containing protein [Bacteroidales bacterium]|nr:DUF349 domain-containing protein [Bacteroidales bacterium]